MPIKQYKNADRKIAPTIPPARKQGSTLQKIDITKALNFCPITYPSFLDGLNLPGIQDQFDQLQIDCQLNFTYKKPLYQRVAAPCPNRTGYAVRSRLSSLAYRLTSEGKRCINLS